MPDIFPETEARVAEWAEQAEVLGVLLVGSKSRGFSDELSDDDLEVVLTDEAHAKLASSECIDLLVRGEGHDRKLIYDAEYIPLRDLRRKETSPFDLDHWPYQQSPVLFDRDEQVAGAVKALAQMDPGFRQKRLLHGTIDAWTSIYRAKKTLKRGAQASGRLLVGRSVRALSRVVFALEWRWVPMDHWFEPELGTLQDESGVGPSLIEGLVNADPEPLEAALNRLEDTLFDNGVPRPSGRHDLFLELIHPDRSEERGIHGLH